MSEPTFQVVSGKATDSARCTVKINDTIDVFTNFVAIGYNDENGSVKLAGNADVLTLSIALEIISKQFRKRFGELSPEDQLKFKEIISGGLM